MEKLGFSKSYIQFTEILYKDNKSIIINNGFLSETVMILRGLRQGCPVSLALYVIQGEITTENINNDNIITGLIMPNSKKQLKISEYADDSNFFSQDQKPVKNVLKHFQKLKEAIGATINLEKTTVIPIKTDTTTNLPKLDFQQIWKNTCKSYTQPFCTDLNYRLLHYSMKTNEYMHKCTKDIHPKCNYCQNIENNIISLQNGQELKKFGHITNR